MTGIVLDPRAAAPVLLMTWSMVPTPPPLTAVHVNGHDVRVLACTFGDMPTDQPFVYVGSMGFIAIGVARGRADVAFEAHAGTPVRVLS